MIVKKKPQTRPKFEGLWSTGVQTFVPDGPYHEGRVTGSKCRGRRDDERNAERGLTGSNLQSAHLDLCNARGLRRSSENCVPGLCISPTCATSSQAEPRKPWQSNLAEVKPLIQLRTSNLSSSSSPALPDIAFDERSRKCHTTSMLQLAMRKPTTGERNPMASTHFRQAIGSLT